MADRLLFTGGTVHTPLPEEADLLVEDGRVAALLRRPGESGQVQAERVDAAGLMVLPGAIDAHVHGRDPGFPEKETFSTLTEAAAAGGVTTVLDMPNTMPGVDCAEVLTGKAGRLEASAKVDFGLYGLIRSTTTADQVGELAAAGAIGFKAYLGYAWRRSTRQVLYAPELSDDDLEAAPDYGTLARLAPAIAATNLPLVVHAEDPSVLRTFSRPAPATYAEVLAGRPALAEATAIAAIGQVARANPGLRVHIAHLSSALGLAAARGSGMTVETAPQYLWFSDVDAERLGTLIKMYPAVRTATDRAALRAAAIGGEIDIVATDHAPHADAEKIGIPFGEAAPGNPGVQTLYLSCLELGRESGQLARAVAWVTLRPAQIFGLHPRKGVLQPGSDADIVLVDPSRKARVEPTGMRSKQVHSPFQGTEFGCSIRAVYLRGRPAGEETRGRFIRPADRGSC